MNEDTVALVFFVQDQILNNVFDEFAETGVQSTPLSNQTIQGATVRSFVTNVLRPRTIGVRFTYTFMD